MAEYSSVVAAPSVRCTYHHIRNIHNTNKLTRKRVAFFSLELDSRLLIKDNSDPDKIHRKDAVVCVTCVVNVEPRVL